MLLTLGSRFDIQFTLHIAFKTKYDITFTLQIAYKTRREMSNCIGTRKHCRLIGTDSDSEKSSSTDHVLHTTAVQKNTKKVIFDKKKLGAPKKAPFGV